MVADVWPTVVEAVSFCNAAFRPLPRKVGVCGAAVLEDGGLFEVVAGAGCCSVGGGGGGAAGFGGGAIPDVGMTVMDVGVSVEPGGSCGWMKGRGGDELAEAAWDLAAWASWCSRS